MEEILTADSLRCYQQKNWETPFILNGKAGERIFVHGTRDQCRFLFEMLSGLRTPDAGQVRVLGQDLYELPEPELAVFRREKIGAIPQGGGFLPEFSILEQLLWPLRLSGQEMEVLRSRIQALNLRYFPTHNLYNPAKRCTVRTRSLAGMLFVLRTLFTELTCFAVGITVAMILQQISWFGALCGTICLALHFSFTRILSFLDRSD